MKKASNEFIKNIGSKCKLWKEYKQQVHGKAIGPLEEEKALDHLFEISEGDVEYAGEILDHAMNCKWERFQKIDRKGIVIESKNPTVSIERVIDSEDGEYEYYSITADTGVIEELTLNDIRFIRDGIDKLIKEKEAQYESGI